MVKYRFSYTAVSFMLNEMVKIAEIYRRTQDWDITQAEVLSENIIQKKSPASSRRMFGEFKLRISHLTMDELDVLVDGYYDDQVQIVLLAICKSYRIIEEFIVGVLRNKFLVFDTLLLDMDYLCFVEEKEAVIPEFESLADSTKSKLKRVLLFILEESGLLSAGANKVISPVILTDAVKKAVVQDDPHWLKVFLMSDTDIKRIIEGQS